MNTTENNKLIAEFMGIYLKNDEYRIDNEDLKWMVISANSWLNDLEEQDFDFHCSWDWLMEVVEKIESLNESNNVLIGTNITYLQIHNITTNEQETFKRVAETKIEAVYNACVTFIEWYNEQPK